MCNYWGKKRNGCYMLTHTPATNSERNSPFAYLCMEKNSCNLKFKGSAFKVYLFVMPLGPKQRLGTMGIRPAPCTSALSNHEDRTMQGNCCCSGTSGRGTAPKVLLKQTPGQSPAASVRETGAETGLCHCHVPHSPKSRVEAVGTR